MRAQLFWATPFQVRIWANPRPESGAHLAPDAGKGLRLRQEGDDVGPGLAVLPHECMAAHIAA